MHKAKFIEVIDNIKYICNICTEEIANDKVVSLACNPSKHIYCYDCIFDWYNQLKNKPNISNYETLKTCPICRKDGGYLPLYGNKYIRGIHGTKCNHIVIENKCNYISNDNHKCSNIGHNRYGGFCYEHKKIESLCNVKLTSKVGFCKNKANKKYNGCCHVHYKLVQVPVNTNINEK